MHFLGIPLSTRDYLKQSIMLSSNSSYLENDTNDRRHDCQLSTTWKFLLVTSLHYMVPGNLYLQLI